MNHSSDMHAHPAPRPCPRCGEIILADSLEGNCPACLMRLAVAGNFSKTGAAVTSEPSDASRSTLHASGPTPSTFAKPPFVARTLGDYELLEEIARGGMGIVYKARQKSLNRTVAVKLLLFGELSSEAFIQRFRVEAQAAASLKHPNIVSIHEIGQEAGQHYFSMEYVEGQNLAQLVRDKPLSPKKAAAYVKVIAEAIQSAHEKGILHRDLKPSNVLIDAEDRVRVTDFGLAKRFGVPPSGGQAPGPAEAGTTSELTLTGQVLGTPNYLSPEQALGRKEVSAATDVYALGGILYYLLTARPPFQAETLPETLQQVVNTEPVSPRLLNASVPVDLETICLKCLEKESARRFASAAELASELGRFLRDEPVHARPASRAEKAWRWCRRNPVLAGLLASTVLLLLTVALGSTLAAVRIGRANQTIRGREQMLRQNLYVADMKVASVALEELNLGRAANLVAKYNLVAPDQEDLRGFEWRYLWQLCRGDEFATLTGHARDVTGVAFSPDATILATAGFEKTVKIWDIASRKLRATLVPGFTNMVAAISLAFSPEGRWLAARAGRELVIWETGSWTTGFQTNTGPEFLATSSLVFAPDGKVLATRTHRGVGLWNSSNWEFREMLVNGHDDLGWRLAYAPDGRVLAAATRNQVHVWDLHRRAWVTFPHRVDALRSLAASTNFIAAGDGYGVLALWATATGQLLTSEKIHRSIIQNIVFSPNEGFLVTGSSDQTISLWDLTQFKSNGTRTLRKLRTLRGHLDQVRALAISRDARLLVSGGGDDVAKLWALPTEEKELELKDSWLPLWFSTNGNRFVTLNSDHTVHEWDLVNNRSTRLLDSTADFKLSGNRRFSIGGGLAQAPAVAISADGTILAVAIDSDSPAQQTVELWDMATIRRTRILPLTGVSLRQLIFSPGTQWLGIASSTDVRLVDCASGQEQLIFRNCVTPVAAFASDGKLLATTGPNNTINLWQLSPRSFSCSLSGHEALISAMAFSPDGMLLAAAAQDSTVRIWHVPSARLVHELKGHVTWVHGVAFAPDGRTMATGSTDGNIILWNVTTGQELISLTRPGLMVASLQFAPSGTVLAAGVLRSYGARGPVQLWRAPSFAEIAALEQIRQAERHEPTNRQPR